MKKIALTIAMVSCFAATAAHAAPIGDPSELSGPLTVITFDEIPAGGIGSFGTLFYPGVTISSNGTAQIQTQAFPQHPGIFEGQYYGQGAQSFFIDFASPVAQFGMGIFDPNFNGNILRALDAANNVLESITSPTLQFTLGPPGGSHSTFVGFSRTIADISRIELINAPGDLMGIDTVTFSASPAGVPVPAALGLLGLGLLGLGWRRRTK